MHVGKIFKILGQQDMRLIGRDEFLRGMVGYVVATALLIWWGLPRLGVWMMARSNGDIVVPDYYPLVVGYLAIYLGSVLAGMVFGFVVIDERDQRTFPALLVTPLPPSYYLGYRIIIAWGVAFLIGIGELILLNWVGLALWQLALIALSGALTAPLVLLFMAALSENKVQGFAAVKIIGGAGLLFFGAWFVPESLEFLFGLYPPYWSVKAYWAAAAGDSLWLLYCGIGIVMSIMTIIGLSRWFTHVAYRG